MAWGEQAEWLQEIADEGGPLPTALAERPAIEPHLDFVWRAFNSLSGDRQTVQGWVGQVPFVSIDRFAERYGIDDLDEFDAFHGQIKAMDRVWRDHMTKQMAKPGG